MTQDLSALLERVRQATGPDRELDRDIEVALPLDSGIAHSHRPSAAPGKVTCRYNSGSTGTYKAPRYTASVDVDLALVERVLPGWAWKVGSCSVSDDFWLVPDFNCPVHGERLKAELSEAEWHEGIDIDRRPSGQPALAVIEGLLQALISKGEAA